jgi:hypothetical protein
MLNEVPTMNLIRVMIPRNERGVDASGLVLFGFDTNSALAN